MANCISNTPCNMAHYSNNGFYVNVGFVQAKYSYSSSDVMVDSTTPLSTWFDMPTNHLKLDRFPNIGCPEDNWMFDCWFDLDLNTLGLVDSNNVSVKFRIIVNNSFVVYEWAQNVGMYALPEMINQEQITTTPVIIGPFNNNSFKIQYSVINNNLTAPAVLRVVQSDMSFIRLEG